MRQVREAIKQNRYPQFVKGFFQTLYNDQTLEYPKWAVDALKTVGINLLEEQNSVEQESLD